MISSPDISLSGDFLCLTLLSGFCKVNLLIAGKSGLTNMNEIRELNNKINILRDLLENKRLSCRDAQEIIGLDDRNFSLLFGDLCILDDHRQKNILVCGGAGFIGSNFVRYMLRKYPQYKIVNFDKLTYAGNLDNLRDVENNANYVFVKGDIADSEAVDRAIKSFQIDQVVNFAAETHVDRSIMDPKSFVMTNLVGTYALLETCRQNGNIRYHHISTDEVFGSLQPGDKPFSEDTRYQPRSPYSASKAGSDHLAMAYCHTYGLPVTLSNCSNNYGPYLYPEKFLSVMITNVLEGKKVPVYGAGANIRDWLYVEDHCSAIDAIIHGGRLGETYCVGGDNQFSNLEITNMVLKMMGKSEEMIEFVKDRPGHDFRYDIDYSKLKSELGWQPSVTLEQGLKKMIEWYSMNEWWWKKIKNGEYREYYQKHYQK